MKQFFTIIIGGLLAIVAGIGVSYGAAYGWRFARAHVPAFEGISLASVAASISSPIDGTSISGSKRTIRYTASEEEDLINAAAQALPFAADNRVTATSYIMKNLTLGDVTIEHDADRLLPVASLTKLATAVIAREFIDPDERVTISREIMATYGNTAYFKVGETFKASDLMYPLLMVSSNDAAEALAQDYGREKFIKAMNDWAQSIGAYRTYFADPSGLSPDNVSSANDLTLIIDWIRKNDPGIIDMTALKTKTVRAHTWVNPTHFLSWSYYIGGKNGYTTEANRTSVALFTLGKNKNVYTIIVLGSGNRDADVIKLLAKVRE
ncbi:MAG: serine hydrolase [Patescibacteria group bacterium]